MFVSASVVYLDKTLHWYCQGVIYSMNVSLIHQYLLLYIDSVV